MNGRDALLDQRDDLVVALHELHDVVMATRPYIEATEHRLRSVLLTDKAELVAETLERVDGAIADAAEVLAGVRS